MTKQRALGLRASVRGETRKQSKGWKGNFRDELYPPKAESTWILLCPGTYEDHHPDAIKDNGGTPPVKPYFSCPTHTYKYKEKGKDQFRTRRCAEGWDGSEGDCLGCHELSQGDKRVGFKRKQYSINIIHFALYHKADLKGADGKTRRFEEDAPDGKHKRGDPIRGWQEVTRRRDRDEIMDDLENLIEEGEVALFRKKYLKVGKNHLENLMEIADRAKTRCRCGGRTEPVVFFCQGCGDELTNVVDANMDANERDNYALERQRCDGCGVVDFPDVEYECDECDEPEPLEYWEVVAKIRKVGENTSSTITIEEIMPIYEFELQDGYGIIEFDDDNEPVLDEDGDFVLAEDIAKLASNPFDFDTIHTPMDNDYIAKILGVENVFGDKGAKGYGASKRRGRGRDEEEEEEEEDEKPRKGGSSRSTATRGRARPSEDEPKGRPSSRRRGRGR